MKLSFELATLYPRQIFRIHGAEIPAAKSLLLHLNSDGLNGHGECLPMSFYGGVEESVTEVQEVAKRINAQNAGALIESVRNKPLKSGLQMALYDLEGKQKNVPVHQLLGLKSHSLPATSFTIGLDSVALMKRKILAANSFKIFKIKMGGPHDPEILQMLRGLPDKRFRIDANGGWSLRDAVSLIQEFNEMENIEMIEQPFPTDCLEEVIELKKHTRLPIMADESVRTSEDIPKVIGIFDGINIKLAKCGGINEALRMITLARRYKLRILMGCMLESSIGITAAAHLSPIVDYCDLDGNLLIANDPYRGVKVDAGRILLTQQAGLGVEARPRLPWRIKSFHRRLSLKITKLRSRLALRSMIQNRPRGSALPPQLSTDSRSSGE